MGDRTMPPPPPRGPANPRKKFAVKPGFSMLDWNVLKARAKNLAGDGGGEMREITKEEVRRHNSQHDCWSIFRGKVYNLTPFLHYHPGGVAELMKGAGKDCTALFYKYHPWVNFDTLVGQSLCVGTLAKKARQGKDKDKDKDKDGEDNGKDEGDDGDEDEETEALAESKEVPDGSGIDGDIERTVQELERMSCPGRNALDRAESADPERAEGAA